MRLRAAEFCVAVALAVGALVLADGPHDAPAAGDPRCFGAADRDPEKPCRNPKLDRRVTPTPDQALLTPNLACKGARVDDKLANCAFGASEKQAVATVAIIGDSHAAHWRAALEVTAKAKRWRVLEVAVPHCPFSTARPVDRDVAKWCPNWNRRVVEWLSEHPEVRTIFLSNAARAPIVVARNQTRLETRARGYLDQWSQLPASVARIIVLRDVPSDRFQTQECVRRAIRLRRMAARMCAVRRAKALPTDAQTVAAERMPGKRAHVVDLSLHFCRPAVCLPVVGGVLVHKDVDHLTQVFARTLGPYLLRAVNRVIAAHPDPYDLPQ